MAATETKTGTETTTEKVEFDTKKALDNVNFLKFLAAHDDAETFDMQDTEKVSARFETFNKKESTRKQLKQIMSGQIQTEMGMKLGPEDLVDVDTHIDRLSIDNPEELKKLQDTIGTYSTTPAEISRLENQLVKKTPTTPEQREEERKKIELAEKTVGGFNNMKTFMLSPFSETYSKQRIARAELTAKYGKDRMTKEGLGEERSNIQQVEDLTKSLEDAKKVFDDSRRAVFADMETFKSISEGVQKKARKEIESVMTGRRTVKDLEKAYKRLEELTEAAGKTETNVDPLASPGFDPEKTREAIEAMIEGKTSEEVEKAVRNAQLGNGGFSRLEKTLEEFTKKDKIGSKEGEEVKVFVIKSLEDAKEDLKGNDETTKAKRIMVIKIIADLQNN